jgi:hypothetical protein
LILSVAILYIFIYRGLCDQAFAGRGECGGWLSCLEGLSVLMCTHGSLAVGHCYKRGVRPWRVLLLVVSRCMLRSLSVRCFFEGFRLSKFVSIIGTVSLGGVIPSPHSCPASWVLSVFPCPSLYVSPLISAVSVPGGGSLVTRAVPVSH